MLGLGRNGHHTVTYLSYGGNIFIGTPDWTCVERFNGSMKKIGSLSVIICRLKEQIDQFQECCVMKVVLMEVQTCLVQAYEEDKETIHE